MTLSPFIFALKDSEPSLEQDFFARALKNARFAMGNTHPNPSVGAVLVKNRHNIGEGYTEPAGGMHAEKMALSQAKTETVGASLYVTLEPCSHHGRTPPCTDAIIEAGITRVIYGAVDPNPLVAGSGIKALQAAGISVEMIHDPAAQAAAKEHIKPFAAYILERRPYVVVKVAASADNVVASLNGPLKITGPKADIAIHRLRRAVDAVLVGAATQRIDDPELTARLGEKGHGAQPLRIIISADLMLNNDARIFDLSKALTWVLTTAEACASKRKALLERGIVLIDCPTSSPGVIDLANAFKLLAEHGITSILIEAGPRLLKNIMSVRLADEIWWFNSPHEYGPQGLEAGMEPHAFATMGYGLCVQQGIGEDILSIWQLSAATSQG